MVNTKHAKTKEEVEQQVGAYLDTLISNSGKTQTAIAKEVGFKRPNIISMICKGTARLPMDKIPAMARSIGVDPAHLGRVVISAYEPELWDMLNSVVFSDRRTVSKNEFDIISAIREVNSDDPKPTPSATERLQKMFSA